MSAVNIWFVPISGYITTYSCSKVRFSKTPIWPVKIKEQSASLAVIGAAARSHSQTMALSGQPLTESGKPCLIGYSRIFRVPIAWSSMREVVFSASKLSQGALNMSPLSISPRQQLKGSETACEHLTPAQHVINASRQTLGSGSNNSPRPPGTSFSWIHLLLAMNWPSFYLLFPIGGC